MSCWSRRRNAFFAALLLFAGSHAALPIGGIDLSIDDIVSPAASLRGVTARLAPDGRSEVTVDQLTVSGRTWRKLSIACSLLRWSATLLRCDDGRVKTGELTSDLAFSYAPADKRLVVTLQPGAAERWRVDARLVSRGWRVAIAVNGGQLARFADWLPNDGPRPSQGTVDGTVTVAGNGTEIADIEGALRWSALAFADAAGLRAGEKLGGELSLRGKRIGRQLDWHAELAWQDGEVFWSPLYFAGGGHRLMARGTLSENALHVEDATLTVKDVGLARFSLDWDRQQGLSALSAQADELAADGLYTLLLKPYLAKTAFDQLSLSGSVDARLRYADAALQEVDVKLKGLDLTDAHKRFSIDDLHATLPWHTVRETRGDIRLAGATALGLPIGAFAVPVKMRGFDFLVDEVNVPLFDGKLLVRDLKATRGDADWRWQFSGVLLPVSMQALTKALDLPVMGGVLSATVPRLAYDQGRVAIDGGIGIRVFDGDVMITEMSLLDPFGGAPRLNADVAMRNLDLDLLTSTFSFGSMQGRIDVDINALVLSNWRPVQFDARIESSAGDYPRKISQQAVENISSLGGAGAAAAIQRSLLRFFEQFGYQKLGLSCRLRNNVCEMSGIESAPQGYIIVKGGGIPAITVKGYNRQVDWDELVERLQRITQDNVQPVIR